MSKARESKKRIRSPSYPAINLAAAIDRARTIYEHERRNAAPVNVILGHWKYAKNSGAGLVQLAALKKYGLLSESGGGDNRKVQLTERAVDILIYDDENDQLDAIQGAARSPKVYQDILSKWPEDMPSDATLRAYLIKEKNFNDRAVDDLIKVTKATFSFAKLLRNDKPEYEGQDIRRDEDVHSAEQVRRPQANRTGSRSDLPLPILMGGGAVRVVSIPKMTAEAFEFFKKQLDAYKEAIIVDAQDGEANAETG